MWTAQKIDRAPFLTRGTIPPSSPRTIAQCDPPSSSEVIPTRKRALPASFRSIVTHFLTSGTWPIALMSKVGGMARLFPSWVYSL